MKDAKQEKMDREVWVGIDWGDREHAVSVVSAQAEALDQFRVPNSPEGYRTLDERVRSVGRVQGVAVEATRHPLLVHLMEQDVALYLINPKVSKAWRSTETVSGAKSDDRDGLTLARGLAFRHAMLRPVAQGDAELARLSLLCEKECRLIHGRTALVQELQAHLKVYYPAALAFFEDWTGPAAWDFLKRFPTPAALAKTRPSALIRFLKGHRLGYSAHWKEKVETRVLALDWPVHPQEDVYQLEVRAIVGQLHAIETSMRQFRAAIEEAFDTLPSAKVIASLPGAGPKLAPRLAAIAGSPEAQEGGLAALRGYTGVAPVTFQSGKRTTVRIRRMCNKDWRNTMHLFAWCSTRFSRWAGAFYRYRKACGDTHSTALRKLADKWLKIIRHMLNANEPYDEDRYLNELKRKNSPVWQFMQQATSG